MKLFQVPRTVVFATIFSASLISCSKEKEMRFTTAGKETPAPSPNETIQGNILGRWSANLFLNGKSIPDQMILHIKEDGVFEVFDLRTKHTGAGQWIINGNSFEGSCTFTAQVKSYYFKAGITESFQSGGGIWGYDDKASTDGVWNMTKQSD